MLVPCPECNVEEIDDARNKRKMCKKCADKENLMIKRAKKLLPPMSYDEGCRKALHDNSNTSIHAASMVKCRPLRLNITKNSKTYKNSKTNKNSIKHLLIHNDELQDLTNELEIEPGEPSHIVEVEFDFPAENSAKLNYCENCSDPKNTIDFQDISNIISQSQVPKLLNHLGPYSEIDNEVLQHLNTDFRLHPNKLNYIPQLFAGALIYDGSLLIALTTEVYSRHASLDIHLESGGVDSVPSSTCHYKNRMSCSIISSADGRGLMRKLIIGSRTINTLITCSSDIGKTHEVNVGPQVSLSLSQVTSKNTRVFLQTEEVEHFKKAFEQSPSYQFQSVSSLRQLSSSFDHISTYKPYRATLYDFDDTRFMPVTVFTLCDTPNHDGYGSLHKSCAKLGSLLLQKVAIALNTKTDLDYASLDDFFAIYDNASKTEDAASWKLLDDIVNDIKERYEKTNNQDINVKSFIAQANLSKLANLVGSSLSKANEKIKANVKERILNLYK